MPRYFAQIENGIVSQVIVADSKEWCEKTFGGEWVETFLENPEKNYAGKGYSFNAEKNNFIGEKPFNSWELDAKLQWKAPKQIPVKKKDTIINWNEEKKDWEYKDIITGKVLVDKIKKIEK